MAKENHAVCPICNGTGKLEDPRVIQMDIADIKREMAIKLREKGYSLRQIQKALGYKSPRSVFLILKEKDNTPLIK